MSETLAKIRENKIDAGLMILGALGTIYGDMTDSDVISDEVVTDDEAEFILSVSEKLRDKSDDCLRELLKVEIRATYDKLYELVKQRDSK